jgi:PadR family transcriptional regulator PadR
MLLFIWESNMKEKSDVWQGTLSLMVLKTLNILGPQHGYGIARRIEQTSENLLSINHGTLYPVLLKLEQEGTIDSEWGVSENNRKARFYRITRDGKKALTDSEREWQRANDIMARFSEMSREPA